MTMDFDFSYLLRDLPIERQMLIFKEALFKSPAGRQNLIEPIIEDNIVKFRLNYYGGRQSVREVMEKYQDAFQRASELKISEFYDLSPDDGFAPTKFRDVSSILEAINEGVPTDQAVSAQILIHKNANKSTQEVAKFIRDMRDAQTDQGLIMMNDDSAIVVNFRQGGRILSTDETIDLLVAKNKQLVSADEIAEALRSDNPNAKLNALFSKIAKRAKGVYSPRDVSLAGEALAGYLEMSPTATTSEIADLLRKKVLASSETFEIFAEFAGIDTMGQATAKNLSDQTLDAIAYAKYKIDGSLNSVSQYIEEMQRAGKQVTEDVLRNHIRDAVQAVIDEGNYDPAQGKFGVTDLIQKLKAIKGDTGKELSHMADEIRKGFDGSVLLNIKNNQARIDQIDAQIATLKSPSMSNADKKLVSELLQEREQLQQKISQGTLRGSINYGPDRFYMMKAAGAAEEFGEITINGRTVNLSEYAILASETIFKKESAAAAGVPIVNLSGLAESAERVYADPMLLAFHGDTLATDADIEMMKKLQKSYIQEMNAVVTSGRLSEDHEIIRAARSLSNVTLDDLLPEQQFSKMMGREWQRAILEFHTSGISIDESLQYLNLISDFYRNKIYTFRKGMYLPTMAEVYRFAINSEANALPGEAQLLTNRTKHIIKSGQETFEATKFRVRNHQILLHHDDVRKFYHVLGGFDLDDKALPIIGTYMSEGQKRLAFSLTRQPTGEEEIGKLLIMNDDIESYRQMFRHNKVFMQTLGQMQETGADVESLFTILNPEKYNTKNMDPYLDFRKIEQSTIAVLEQMYGAENLRKFDDKYIQRLRKASHMSVSELFSEAGADPEFGRLGVQKLRSEVERMNIAESVRKVLERDPNILGESETQRLLSMSSSDPNTILAAIKDVPDTNKITNLMNKVYHEVDLARALKIAERPESSLGLYINRATIAGHWLDQLGKLNVSDIESQTLRSFGMSINLLPTETPVDLTQTMTSGRLRLNIQAMQEIGEGVENEQVARTLLAKSLGVKESSLNNISLNEINPLRAVGGQMGYINAARDPDQLSGIIDQLFKTSGKLTDDDILVIGKAIGEGLEIRRSQGNLTQDQLARVNEMIHQFSRTDIDPNQMYETLKRAGYIAGAENPLATLSKVNAVGMSGQDEINAVVARGTQSFAAQKQRLLAQTNITALGEASQIVDSIVSQNEQLFQEVISMVESNPIERLASYNTDLDIVRGYIGQNVLDKIDETMQRSASSGYELINAIQYELAQNPTLRKAKMGLGQLRDLTAFADGTRGNLLRKYTNAARAEKSYLESVRNIDLRDAIDDIFGSTLIDEEVMEAIGNAGKYRDFLSSQMDNILDPLRNRNLSEDVISQVSRGLLGEEIVDADAAAKNIISAVRLRAARDLQRFIDPVGFEFLERRGPGLSSAGAEGAQMTDEVLEFLSGNSERGAVNKTRYKRIGVEYIKEKFANKNIRNAFIAGGALVAASFIYQKKKDRSVDDISGPPLLPGGSSYEDEYPVRIPQIPTIGSPQQNYGTSYRINTSGSQDDIDKLRSALSGVTNSNINYSRFNGAPNPTRNPYQQMGSSY